MEKSHKSCMEQVEIIDTFGTYQPASRFTVSSRLKQPSPAQSSTTTRPAGGDEDPRHPVQFPPRTTDRTDIPISTPRPRHRVHQQIHGQSMPGAGSMKYTPATRVQRST